MQTTQPTTVNGKPGLARVLGLGSLVIYGLVMIQPTAPMPLYGEANRIAHGHVVTLILIGMVAMLFTALSYGRMANAYPAAGSAYTYVGRELHPALGYLTGWSMMFDYVMNPIICVIWCSKATVDLRVLPGVPVSVWFVAYALLFTGLNLRAIRASARTNTLIAGGLLLVLLFFFAAAFRHLVQAATVDADALTRPFYNPDTFSWKSLSNGAALAVLTYIGFDGISTLSEEVHNPRRNVLLATVLVCLIIGLLSAAEVYVAQLVWPEPASTFTSLENAFAHVGKRVGGQAMFALITVALVVASIGSGMGAHLGASRLLYGMGRDEAIPKRFFGQLHPRTHVPANNIMLVGGIALVGAFVLDYDQRGYALGAQLLNFGALTGFMGVNLSALTHYFVRGRDRRLRHLVPPILGFLICLYLWVSLARTALWVGMAWLILGVLYGAWRTSWFRKPLPFARIDSGEDEVKPSSSANP
jgi:amino acid transporter